MSTQKNQKPLNKINIFTLGDPAVGKTSYILRFCKNEFQNFYLATIGFDFIFKNITLSNGQTIKIYFHDTAGQEKYRAIAYNMIKSADALLLMYDISKKETFTNIDSWIDSIKQKKGMDFPIVLIGNKCDLDDEREVKKEEGLEKANKYHINFFECSNKEKINIDDPVICLLKQLFKYNNDQNLQKVDTIELNKEDIEKYDINNKKKESNC